MNPVEEARAEFESLLWAFQSIAAPFGANNDLIPLRSGGQYTIPAICNLSEEQQQPYLEQWRKVENMMEQIKWCRYVHMKSNLTTFIKGTPKEYELIKENTEEAVNLLANPDADRTVMIMSLKTARHAEDKLWEWIKYRGW